MEQRDAVREVEGLGLVGKWHAGADVLCEVEFVAQLGECRVEARRRGRDLLLVLRADEDGERHVGAVELAEAAGGQTWADSGEAHDQRGLKQRTDGEVRIVPIPPPLVRLLRVHGTAADGRLFASERGNVVAASSYSCVWKQTRELALPPRQVSSVLAARPYDLRHAGVSQ